METLKKIPQDTVILMKSDPEGNCTYHLQGYTLGDNGYAHKGKHIKCNVLTLWPGEPDMGEEILIDIWDIRGNS